MTFADSRKLTSKSFATGILLLRKQHSNGILEKLIFSFC